MAYREELLQERLRPSSESGCIFTRDVASKEEFLFGRERLFVKWGGGLESGSSGRFVHKNMFL